MPPPPGQSSSFQSSQLFYHSSRELWWEKGLEAPHCSAPVRPSLSLASFSSRSSPTQPTKLLSTISPKILWRTHTLHLCEPSPIALALLLSTMTHCRTPYPILTLPEKQFLPFASPGTCIPNPSHPPSFTLSS